MSKEIIDELKLIGQYFDVSNLDVYEQKHHIRFTSIIKDRIDFYINKPMKELTELRDEYLQPELDKYKNIKVERQSEPLCDHDFKPNKQGADVCVKCGLPYAINC